MANHSALIGQIQEALKNLVTLEIITAVGPVKIEEGFADIDPEGDPKVILSKIDLLQGDIKTVYDEEYVTGNYKELKEFHKEREKEGHAIIKGNIATIKELLMLLKSENEPKA